MNITESNGLTRFWPGTHILSHEQQTMAKDSEGFIEPLLNVGDALLLDMFGLHQGMSNQTEQSRLYLKITYSRPWFRDSANQYRNYTPTISDDEFAQVPEHHKALFEPYTGQKNAWYFF